MPASTELRYVLKKLSIRSLGDLSTIAEKDLRAVFKNSSQLIAELDGLIDLARTAHSDAVPAPFSPVIKLTTLPANTHEVAGSHHEHTASVLPPAPVEYIFIPTAERGRSVKAFVLSVRLRNVLEAGKIQLTGDLHGKSYAEIARYRNCGRKTLVELRELVRLLQSSSDEVASYDQQPTPINTTLIVVPPSACDLKLTELPLSVRLENVLKQGGYRSLGELDGVDVGDLLNVKNCGRKSILELRELIYRAGKGEFSATAAGDIASRLREVASAIDAGFARLSGRDRKIYEARLFGNNGSPRKLEDVGTEFKMTRERVRQIVKKVMLKIRRGGGPKLGQALQVIAGECQQRVCPLTPELFAHWLGKHASLPHSAQFYVCALDHMDQAIPAWPPGSIRDGDDDLQSVQIENALETWMRPSCIRPTAQQAYAELRQQSKFRELLVGTFLGAVRRARRIIVDFPAPEHPELRLRRIRMRILEFARPVLADSSEPLTPEEIVERAKARYGEEAIVGSARGAINALTPAGGFFLLGPRSLGLRQHFLTRVSRWPELCDQFEKLLHVENRPLSTIEAVAQDRIQGFEQTTSYEMAQILRENTRFTDLGRRLFALTEWGVQEREHVKDLLPRVFAKANRVLTVEQTLERLTRLRSVSPYSISNILRKHSDIRSFGFGYYGLKDWGDSAKEVILRDRTAIEHAVRRATPPVSFKGLCDIFGVSIDGTQAGLLWKSCAGSSKLRRAPDKQSPETLLLHKSVSLEQALATIARALQRPAPAYELHWELCAKFGEIFAHIGLSKIDERLTHCERFLRNTAGEFLLDEDFDLADFDLDALRAASIKSLTESHDIAGCDELIERLEMQGFKLDELSEDMLASILRGAEGLQEVGHQRFRAR